MKIHRTIRSILQNPFNQGHAVDALVRYLRWQLGSRIAPGKVAIPWINEARLLVAPGDTGLTGCIYSGLHDYADMSFLLRFLREEDIFLDVGANAGAYTVLASAAAGAQTISFEPVPRTFAKLLDNVAINTIQDKVTAYNMGVGNKKETLNFSVDNGASNRVINNTNSSTPSTAVPVDTLDSILQGSAPAAIKMDIEGFEYNALTGASNTLASQELCAIIIELKEHALKYGSSNAAIDELIRSYGFLPYQYDNTSRTVSLSTDGMKIGGNVLYLRNLEHVQHRLTTCAQFSIFGQTL